MAITPDMPDAYETTPDEALSKLDAALAHWAMAQTLTPRTGS